jgi:hypothetical protein
MSLLNKNSNTIISFGNIKKIHNNIAGIVDFKEFSFFFESWSKRYFQINKKKISFWKNKYKNKRDIYFKNRYYIKGYTSSIDNKKYYTLIIYENSTCFRNKILEFGSHNFKGIQLIYNTIENILENL